MILQNDNCFKRKPYNSLYMSKRNIKFPILKMQMIKQTIERYDIREREREREKEKEEGNVERPLELKTVFNKVGSISMHFLQLYSLDLYCSSEL